MVLPNHIAEAERNGMPEDKPVFANCPQCDRNVNEEIIVRCDVCGRVHCMKCRTKVKSLAVWFCSPKCAIKKLVELLEEAESKE